MQDRDDYHEDYWARKVETGGEGPGGGKGANGGDGGNGGNGGDGDDGGDINNFGKREEGDDESSESETSIMAFRKEEIKVDDSPAAEGVCVVSRFMVVPKFMEAF